MLVDAPVWSLKAALVAHALASGALVGSSTHFALIVRDRSRVNGRLGRLYPSVSLAAWIVVFALGAAMYPHYRVRVRAEFLDLHARWASTLFDVKENLALLVAPLLLAQWMISRRARSTSDDRALRACAWSSAACIWFNVCAGLLVASVRSVG